MGIRLKNIIGSRYGRLTITSDLGTQPYGNLGNRYRFVRAVCDCQNIIDRVALCNLKSGYTKSCGCLRKEITAKRQVTHGLTGDPVYSVYQDMHRRCYDPSSRSYIYYGGRGIGVEWHWHRDNPEGRNNFLHEVGPRPGLRYSFDRADSNGNYGPNNWRWATLKEQHRNKRSNYLITYKGETKVLAEWSEITGLQRGTIRKRLVLGWSVELALTTPVKRR